MGSETTMAQLALVKPTYFARPNSCHAGLVAQQLLPGLLGLTQLGPTHEDAPTRGIERFLAQF
jgi:hypothetical protein